MCNSKGTFFTPLFSTYNITYTYNFHFYHKPMTLVLYPYLKHLVLYPYLKHLYRPDTPIIATGIILLACVGVILAKLSLIFAPSSLNCSQA